MGGCCYRQESWHWACAGSHKCFPGRGGGGLCFLTRGKHGVAGGFIFNQKNF